MTEQLLGSPVHVHHASIVQLAAHQSSLLVLPSSHTSPDEITPSPHSIFLKMRSYQKSITQSSFALSHILNVRTPKGDLPFSVLRLPTGWRLSPARFQAQATIPLGAD